MHCLIVDIAELRKDKEKNFNERLSFIDKHVEWIKDGGDKMSKLDGIENMIAFLIKENMRLNKRILNLGIAVSDKLKFTDIEEDSILNPDIDYAEEERTIERLRAGKL